MGVLEDLELAREAYERREWVSAYRALSEQEDLAVEDLMALATTAYLVGRRNDCVQALQRAHQTAAQQGDIPAAVRAAYWLTEVLWSDGEMAVGNGWLARARRILSDFGQEVVERGYIQERITMAHVLAGQFAEALAAAPAVAGYGRRFGDPDLVAIGLHLEGRLTVYSGRVGEGLTLLDEAMIAVVAGEVSPIFAGSIYCSSIEACQELSDFGRAGQWTHALATWCDAQPDLVAFTGQCAVHRGQLMRLHGAFDDAVRELERAAERYALVSGGEPALALAHYERGEVLRLKGDYDAAEAAFATAAELGHSAQPGRALLRCDRGRHPAAVSAIRQLLAERVDPVHRSQVLAAAVTVLVRAGEIDEATPLASELTACGDSFGCTALQASAAYARACIALERGEADRALGAARRAAELWTQLSGPYEAARSRVIVGSALRMLGDEESGTAELRGAKRTFGELGAAADERAVTKVLSPRDAPGGLSPREVEVLRLVAAGKSNSAIAAELVLAEKTVARHLSNIFTKLGVRSRTAAAAFAHEHDLI